MKGENVNLSLNECRVMTGLCQFPTFSDSKIADMIGINHSTFATVKKRLQQDGLFNKYRLPNLSALGVEILSVLIKNLRKNPSTAPNNLSRIDISLNSPNILFSLAETNFSLLTVAHQNFTELGEFLSKYDRFTSGNQRINHESKLEIHFPLFFSLIPRFLDFSRSLPAHLGLSPSPAPLRTVFPKVDYSEVRITKLGWRIFRAYLEFPEYTSKQIAQIVNKPRTTVSRWLRALTQADLISPIIIPNFQKLGYQLFLIGNLAVRSSNKKIFSHVLSICDEAILPVVLMQTDHDVFYISPFSTLEDAQKAEFEFIQKMNDARIGFRRVFRSLVSLPHSTFTLKLNSGFLEFADSLGRSTL
ncbi:MAG: winged helix-turn-helix domain-containing protein [Candidatus Heimdallarchaeota archaeon]